MSGFVVDVVSRLGGLLSGRHFERVICTYLLKSASSGCNVISSDLGNLFGVVVAS